MPIKKAGAYQLRAALRDHGSEHIGSASQFIEVPDIKKNRLVVSGILVTAIDPAAAKQRSAEAGAADANKSPGNQNTQASEVASVRISAATRQFKPGQILQYSFVIYNARLVRATAQPQLTMQVRLIRDGQPIFTGKETSFNNTSQSDLKRITHGGGLELGRDLAPGEYVLQVTVIDPLADEKHRVATQWIDFEVVK